MATLYIVATPIGNLEDITMRALRILNEVDYILCEDTRVTKKLLNHYQITTPTVSYHQYSRAGKMDKILSWLAEGKDLALVSDAGTPGISDPGGRLVQAVVERFGLAANDEPLVRIEAVPGPSAVTAALSISGLPTDKFVFLGFPPHKKGRQKFLKRLLDSPWPVVVYESKHRIVKFLEELNALANKMAKEKDSWPEKDFLPAKPKAAAKEAKELVTVVVCREISKKYETVYRGQIKDILAKIKADKQAQKGEFVVIVKAVKKAKE